MSAFYKFPKIRGVEEKLKAINGILQDDTCELEGVVKLHGCCTAIVKHAQHGEITFQSRNRIITTHNDHISFANSMTKDIFSVQHIFEQVSK